MQSALLCSGCGTALKSGCKRMKTDKESAVKNYLKVFPSVGIFFKVWSFYNLICYSLCLNLCCYVRSALFTGVLFACAFSRALFSK